MTAKEYLGQLESLDVKIHHEIQEKKALWESLGSISSPDFSKERVSGGNVTSDAAFVNKICKIFELEAEIEQGTNDYYDLKHTIIGQIHDLQNLNHIKLLYKLYVENKSLKQIAKEMHYAYDYVRTMHLKALQEFEKTHIITQ